MTSAAAAVPIVSVVPGEGSEQRNSRIRSPSGIGTFARIVTKAPEALARRIASPGVMTPSTTRRPPIVMTPPGDVAISHQKWPVHWKDACTGSRNVAGTTMEADLELPMVAPSGPIVASVVHSPTLISRVKGSAGREGPAGTARSNDGGAAAVGDVERKVCFRARSVERDIPGFAKLFSPRAVSGRTSALGVVPLLGPSRREPTSETPVPLRRDSAAAPVLIEPRKFDFNLGGDAEVSALGVLTSDGLIDDPQVVQKLEPLPSSVPQLSQKRIIYPYFHEQHNKTR